MAAIEARRSKDGTITYRVKVRAKGQGHVSATFSRLTDAKRWEKTTEAAIVEGRYFKTSEAKRHTVAELVDRYLAEVLPHKPRNASNTRLHLNWWKKRVGHLLLSELTSAQIVQCRNELLASTTRRHTSMSPSTVTRYLAALSVTLNVAVREWEWLDDSPMRKVSKPRQPRGRERWLDDAEREALLNACKASSSRYLHTVVVVALSTGMRAGEIMSMSWPQVDLARGQIRLTETKNGTSRSVPLSGFALTLMQDLSKVRRIGTSLVFPGADPAKPVDLKKPWTTAVRKAGLKDFRFHDLRHSAASYLAMNGASTIEIAAILGHKTLVMVKRYSHLANSHVATVVARMNDRIFGGAQ